MTLLSKLAQSPGPALDAGLLLLRAWFGLVLAFVHGLGKITDLAKFTEGVASRGLPLPGLLGPAAALSEFLGGLLLAVGLLTRPSALCVAITMLVAALHIHASDPFGKKELACAYAAVALVVLVTGPGGWSLDAKLFRSAGAARRDGNA